MAFNYNKLRGRIKERCKTEKAFADELGITVQTLSSRFNHGTNFKQPEIAKATEILEIAPEEIATYFFNVEL